MKKAEWIKMFDDGKGVTDIFRCSECDRTVIFPFYSTGCDYIFCPFCGVRMRG